MANYKMTVEILIMNVPEEVSIQEAKVTSEIWIRTLIPDVDSVSFEELK